MLRNHRFIILARFRTKNTEQTIKVLENILESIFEKKLKIKKSGGTLSLYLNNTIYAIITLTNIDINQHYEDSTCIEIYVNRNVNKNIRILLRNIASVVAILSSR